MKICRYDDDRLGIVIGDKIHDVTAAQTEIRNSTPYAAKVDAVVAALPAWRGLRHLFELRTPCRQRGHHRIDLGGVGRRIPDLGLRLRHIVDHVPDHNTKPVIVVAAELH